MCVIYQDAVIVVPTRNFPTVKKSQKSLQRQEKSAFKLLQGIATISIVIYLTLG